MSYIYGEPTRWDRLDHGKFEDEAAVIARLLAGLTLGDEERKAIVAAAASLVEQTRLSARKQGVVEGFLQEFSLGTREGLALMCLAEALLRTPDAATRDRLIAEKITSADWAAHLGKSDSLFVNASTWGLMLTGKLIDVDEETRQAPAGFLQRLAARIGEPVIRQAVAGAVRIMGEQFVLGRTIDDALARAGKEGLLCSFDMLGEGARTEQDALHYTALYAGAIEAVGRAANHAGPEAGHGVSVKLSALYPRYEAAHAADVHAVLYPRLLALAERAAVHDIGLSIDAEEADRLALSLTLVDRLAHEPSLGQWRGLGVVIQAYQKRGRDVVDQVIDLARRSDRRLMIRLVKGAYWDTEIKRAQVAGMPDYPVFTTKAATDLSYLACVQRLIAASPYVYPQFATHNAHSLMAVRQMADRAGAPIEFQRLHGMGDALYQAADHMVGPLRVRTYAPVGGHESLLPYLVRRLLENGANSSFVHVLLDDRVPAADVVRDPVEQVRQLPDRHPRIPVPAAIYGPGRANPTGRDLSICANRVAAAEAIRALRQDRLRAGPMGPDLDDGNAARVDMVARADGGIILGDVANATPGQIGAAIATARATQPQWDSAGGAHRATVLRSMADIMVANMDGLIAMLQLEAGKTFNDAVAEVREAIDFCRYYANLGEQQFGPVERLPGPVGETNEWRLGGRGVFACISPWNFPLAIFTGQIAAALAAGNAVIAKPAEQTPFIAAEAIRLWRRAGLDPALVQLLPGDGAVIGAALVAHAGVDGVAFTGGTDTAATINRTLAARPGPIIPFIAETGGLNAMFVDTTALREQVVDDVLLSAFGSAGQRCSALRMLFLPEESADEVIAALAGAMAMVRVGDPGDAATDIGPVIDAGAKAGLLAHIDRLGREARIIAQAPLSPWCDRGHFVAPTLAEVPRPDFLEREVFGPILHVYRYRAGELADAAARLAARGFGLTLGIHSRLQSFAREVQALVPAGNVYVNRSMIGAVVGVQPFGGIGLSGTGPKAGGPQALLRFGHEVSVSVNLMAQGGDPALFNL